MLFSKSQKETIVVEGMSCAHCENSVENGIQDISGVTKVKANHQKSQVEIYFKKDPPDLNLIRQKIEELGYQTQ